MKNNKNILWGLIFVIIGVFLGLKTLDIITFNIFFDGWWTLFIIIPSLIGLINDDDKTGNLIGLGVGVALLLACNNIISFKLILKLFVPAIIVLIGLTLIFKDLFKKEINKKIKENTNMSYECTSTFTTHNINYDNKKFEGTNLTAIFGGIELDLTNADIKDESVINTTSIFGGINIKVDNDVEVIVKSTGIFGGVENKIKNKTKTTKTIYINATCIFGGVEIK